MFAAASFQVSTDPVRAPSVAFVWRERIAEKSTSKGYRPGAPELVAEVVSPNNYQQVDDKIEVAGCRQSNGNDQPSQVQHLPLSNRCKDSHAKTLSLPMMWCQVLPVRYPRYFPDLSCVSPVVRGEPVTVLAV